MRLGLLASLLCLCTVSLCLADPAKAAIRKDLNIPSEPLSPALQAVGTTFELQVLYPTAIAKDLKTRGASGSLTPEEAFTKVLSGTGLSYKYLDANTVTVFATAASAPTVGGQDQTNTTKDNSKEAGKKTSQDFLVAQVDQANAGPQAVSDQDSERKKQEEALTEVVVTGTRMRGNVPLASPVTQIERAEFVNEGATSIQDVLAKLPENFNGDINTEAAAFGGLAGGINNSTLNLAFASAPDIHGLGAASTLSLLNGIRIPVAGQGVSPDISLIPLLAIERVDVLKDGASPVYGSDAVGGVVNLVTRRDVDGNETTVKYDGAPGGDQHTDIGQSFGTKWASGSAFLAYQFDRQTTLESNKRELTSTIAGSNNLPFDIVPDQHQNSAYANAFQRLTPSVELSFEAVHSQRDYQQGFPGSGPGSFQSGDSTQTILTAAATISAPDKWQVRPSLRWSENSLVATDIFPGIDQVLHNHGRETAAEVSADGPVLDLVSGSIQTALGVAVRRETFAQQVLVGTYVPYDKSRDIRAVFGEINIPIVGASQAVPFVQSLNVSGAVRHDDYSDVGGTTNPRVGIVWGINNELRLRGTYSTAFRAPPLYEGQSLLSSVLFYAADPLSPSGQSLVLNVYGYSRPGLVPETSQNLTIGFDYQPEWLTGLKLSGTYYAVNYRQRIATLDSAVPSIFAFGDPAVETLIQRNPPSSEVLPFFNSPAFVNATGVSPPPGPAAVGILIDDRDTNLFSTKLGGFDFSAAWTRAIAAGELSATASVNVSDRFLVSYGHGIPSVEQAGNAYFPARYRGRGGVQWKMGGWVTGAFVNYTSGSVNAIFAPSPDIGSWTTLDLHVGYATGPGRHFGDGIRVDFFADNALNRGPPPEFIPPSLATAYPHYDAANSSIFGRLSGIQVSKVW